MASGRQLYGVLANILPANVNASLVASVEDLTRCNHCGFGGSDVRVAGCGCSLHARCVQLQPNSASPPTNCPKCYRQGCSLVLFPMSFLEIDEARKAAAALANRTKRNRKRKHASATPGPNGAPGAIGSSSMENEKNSADSDRRTGRWTTEEMNYVDMLIGRFEGGQLPLVDGIKLNDFLATMLKSKQSRLTKKMKNAKLSTKSYKRSGGCVVDLEQARQFSQLEESFFHSIQCQLERAEIKFHMQREWRELFSNYCVTIGQPLDADSWLSSVEEMDRRATMAKDAVRMAKRKLMMGNALKQDGKNPERGVFIDQTPGDVTSQSFNNVPNNNALNSMHVGGTKAGGVTGSDSEDILSLLADKNMFNEAHLGMIGSDAAVIGNLGVKNPSTLQKNSQFNTSPFLAKILSYLQRHSVPFEHIDAWVPSFVPTNPSNNNKSPEGQPVNSTPKNNTDPSCRLCYAGSATTDSILQANRANHSLSGEEQFNLNAFGEYSQKFSFDIGCGLPGRVYQSGVPTWEQSVHNAPLHHFERCGGAIQWGLKTVVGIPVPSPNVGRIVVVLYSLFDRDKDQELVGRLCDEFTKLMPSPKWKLVVDIGQITAASAIPSNQNATAVTPNAFQQTHQANTPQQHQAQAVPAQTNGTQQQQQPTPPTDTKKDPRINDVVSLLGEHMPSDPASPLASYVPGFMSIRLMMLKLSWTAQEAEFIRTLLDSFTNYSSAGRSRSDIAVLLARDCMFLNQQQQQQQVPQHHVPHMHQVFANQQQQQQVRGGAPNLLGSNGMVNNMIVNSSPHHTGMDGGMLGMVPTSNTNWNIN